MGCTLTDQLIGDTFKSLLKTSDNCQLPAAGQIVLSDGCGSNSSISIGKAAAGLHVTGPIGGGDITASGDLLGNVVTANTCITTSGNLYAATTAGNKVGIGTSTPGEKLTVNGSLSASGDLYIDHGGIYTCNGIGSAGQILASTGSKIEWIAASTGASCVGNVCTTGASNTVNHISKFTPDGTSIGDSIIQDNGSLVGIGVSPATHKLKVAGNVCSTGFVGPITGNLTGNICSDTIVDGSLTVNNATNLAGATTVGNINSTIKATLDNVEVAGAFCDGTGDQGGSTQYLRSTGTGVEWTDLPSAGAGDECTGSINGNGTIDRIAKFTGAKDIGDSVIYQASTRIGINSAPDGECTFKVNGGAKITGCLCTTNVVANGYLGVCGNTFLGNAATDSATSCGDFFVGSCNTARAFSVDSTSGAVFTKGTITAESTIFSKGDVIAFSSSDRRLKDNLTCITDSNNIINGLNNYCFDWNDKSEREGPGIGVIAQDVQKVLPNAVCERDNGDLAVDYNQFIPVLLQRVKELSAEVEDLKAKIS